MKVSGLGFESGTNRPRYSVGSVDQNAPTITTVLIVDGILFLSCVMRNLCVEISEEIQRVPVDSSPFVAEFLLCMSLGTCHLVLMIRHEYLLSDKT